MLLLTDRAQPAGGDAQGPNLVLLEAVVWATITLVSLTLIIGTASRMMRR
jgi:hypothetical protein